MAIDIYSFVSFAPGSRRMYLSLPPWHISWWDAAGTAAPPAPAHFQIQEHASTLQLICWEGCFKSLYASKKAEVEHSDWLPQNKALLFFPTCMHNIK